MEGREEVFVAVISGGGIGVTACWSKTTPQPPLTPCYRTPGVLNSDQENDDRLNDSMSHAHPSLPSNPNHLFFFSHTIDFFLFPPLFSPQTSPDITTSNNFYHNFGSTSDHCLPPSFLGGRSLLFFNFCRRQPQVRSLHKEIICYLLAICAEVTRNTEDLHTNKTEHV